MALNSAFIRSLCNRINQFSVRMKQKNLTEVVYRRKFELFPAVHCSIVKEIHSSLPRTGSQEDRRKLIQSMPAVDEGTDGERLIGIDYIKSREDMFPNEDTPNMLFNGIPFKDVPVVYIRVSRNNTIFSLFDCKLGQVRVYRSCGVEGFKNTRKGTNVAAQATGLSFTMHVLNKGYKTVRVAVSGLGPGRLSSIKGLQMAGLEIISVSDITPVSENPPRPPRPKSL